jgi:hypothetical protein
MSNLEDQLAASKARLSRAAERCLNPNDAGAPAEADAALAEVASLQAQLKASKGRQCAEPGCSRFTLRDRCDLHRAAGGTTSPQSRNETTDIWQESRRIMDQIERGER